MLFILQLIVVMYSLGVYGIAIPRAPTKIVALSTKDRTLSKKEQQAINFLAGGLAGTISSTLTAPIEIVKTQLQASVMSRASPMEVVRRVYAADGVPGFFKGIKPLLVGIIPTRAIYFWSYSATKERLKEYVGDSPMNHLASAFAAGITSNTITNPLWMVKTRFQLMADGSAGQVAFKNYKQVIDAILKEEGPRGFFKGLSASYFGCIEGAIQWVAYEKAKAMVVDAKEGEDNSSNNAVEYFFAAAASKALAIILTYPHEVVRTRMREQARSGTFRYSGFVQTLQLIAKEEGRRGLYGGMGMHLLRSVPNAAIMFLSFELVSAYITKAYSTTMPNEGPQSQ